MRECNRRDVNNQRKSQHLKYDRASQADELALVTNALGHVSTLSNTTLSPNKYFSFTNQGVALFILLIKHIYSN
jgi:hypothetical protein